MAIRFALIIGCFGALFLFLIFNLYNLQIKKGGYYLARAEAQYKAGGVFDADRGNFYFTDKNKSLVPVAINKEFPQVYAVPKEIEDVPEAVSALLPLVDIKEDKLRASLSKKGSLFTLLIPKANEDQIKAIKDLNIKGVYVQKEKERFYPLGSMAAQLIGFTSKADDGVHINGLYGLEKQFNSKLSGDPGEVSGRKVVYGKSGEDIKLSIDRNIQAQSEEVIKNLVAKFKAEKGSVIVEDPRTGKILAMASVPNFDPNEFSKSEISSFINPATQLVYEPGSVFKVVTMAAAINDGKVTPETTFMDTGSVTVNGRKIQNWDHKAHGKVTMTNVIEQSLNTGMVFVGTQMDHKVYINYLDKFGFDKLTNIELPGETKGSLSSLKNIGREVNFATASFGQGVAVTPIQMISAIATIANHGVLLQPSVLEDSSVVVVDKVISEDTALKVSKMMVSAVDKAKVAKIDGYSVAGKTGTAFVPDFKRGGYTDDVINTYVGFAPADDAKFVILIKLDKPAGAPLAGLTVVPAFRELAQFILNYYNIPPDIKEVNE